jgi:hypothetical protein
MEARLNIQEAQTKLVLASGSRLTCKVSHYYIQGATRLRHDKFVSKYQVCFIFKDRLSNLIFVERFSFAVHAGVVPCLQLS